MVYFVPSLKDLGEGTNFTLVRSKEGDADILIEWV